VDSILVLTLLIGAFLCAALALARVWVKYSSVKTSLVVALAKAEGLELQREKEVAQARREAELDSRQEAADARASLEREASEARARQHQLEEELRRRAVELDEKTLQFERGRSTLSSDQEELRARESMLTEERNSVSELKEETLKALQKVSGLSQSEAREFLLQRVEDEARSELLARIAAVESEVGERAETTAKNIISMAIQRYAGQYVCERTVSVVPLASDDLKGRIIGREGRNIRAIEAATGVDIIVDDTPDCVVISAYNPIRREVAKAALETLLEDGRVHPTRIESVVRKAEFDFHKVIRAAGDQAAHEVGISGIHPEILKLLGALKYRTSYGQNQWQHSLEVAFMSGMMASELGLDEGLARRAGLLHDIGKVMDQTAEGSHALIGAEFARKHGEDELVVNAIASHHEEVEQKTIYDCLAQAADAISGARPGARREMMQTHNQRLSDLERISNSFPGVDRSYAVQAGREIRVLVENSELSDEDSLMLSREIVAKIEREMSYPGQIKVTVIRETRVVQYAR